MNNTFIKIWRMPVLLGVTTLFGLLSALLGTGIWYGFAWVTLILPLAAIGWYISKPGKG